MAKPATAGRCGGCLRSDAINAFKALPGPGREIAPVADRCAHQVEATGGGFSRGISFQRGPIVSEPPTGSWDNTAQGGG